MHENRETPSVPLEDCSRGRLVKAHGRKTGMHADGESDGSIVPVKQANKAVPTAAESVEERGPTKENAGQEASLGHSAGTASGTDWTAYGQTHERFAVNHPR